MSNHLTEEDPNKKKKQEGTTPSTTPTTATGDTTTPPLSFDGFVGTGTGSNAYQTNVGFYNDQYNTAVDTAKTNKDLGMEYIEGVKNSLYGNAAAQRAEADKNTEVARQRGIIDSQSSYQKAVGAYGSNAETLAGRGLSGSGYGEYLTADAYATHRGQVQNINADALRANREAAYAEKQTQMAADSEYLKNLYGINTEYNNAISKAKSELSQGMYQSALGLNEAQNAAYGKLFDSASKGVSIDAIMQDGTWGDLTPEQQQAITAEAERIANEQNTTDLKEQNYINDNNFANWLSSIGNGKLTLADAQAMSGYENLSPNQKAQLQTAENNRVAKSGLADKTERADRIVTYGDLARGGMSLEELKATMALYGDDWDNLDPKEQKVIQMAADAYTAAQKKLESEDRPNQIAGLADLAAKGYSIDEIKQWAAIYGITNLGENELAVIQSSADRYAAAQEKLNSENEMDRALGYVGLLEAGWTLGDVKALIGTDAWAAMGDEAKTMITKSSEVIGNLKTEAANKDAKGALAAYIEAAGEGLSIDAITAIAMANGHYDVLVGEKGTEEGKTLWDSVVAEADKFTNQNATNDTLTNIEDAINDGATLEEIESMPGYDELDDNVKEQIGEQVTARDEEKELAADAIAISLEGYENLSEVEKYLTSQMVPESERAGIIAKWQSNNVKEFEELFADAKFEDGAMSIGGVKITGKDLYEDIKNGMYGDEGGKVFGKYLDLLVQTAIDTTTPISDAFAIQGILNTLENDLRAEKISDLELLVSKAKQKVPRDIVPSISAVFDTKTIDGKAYVTIDGVAVEDWKTVPTSVRIELDKIASTTANVKTIKVRDTIYYRNSKDGKWYAYKIVQNDASTTSNKGGTTR